MVKSVKKISHGFGDVWERFERDAEILGDDYLLGEIAAALTTDELADILDWVERNNGIDQESQDVWAKKAMRKKADTIEVDDTFAANVYVTLEDKWMRDMGYRSYVSWSTGLQASPDEARKFADSIYVAAEMVEENDQKNAGLKRRRM